MNDSCDSFGLVLKTSGNTLYYWEQRIFGSALRLTATFNVEKHSGFPKDESY